MNNNNMVIRFHGIDKKDKHRHLSEYLEALLRHAPFNSTCHLHIFKEPKAYMCKLTVHSSVKTFSSHSKDETIKLALQTVLRNVKEQIAYWKKNRSSMELTGVTSITHLNLNSLDEDEEEKEEEFQQMFKKSA